jgi:hypothetical protein
MIVAEIKDDYSRSHTLGKQVEGNQGVPLGDVNNEFLSVRIKDPARRQTLLQERKAADQALEWVPSISSEAAAVEKAAVNRDYRKVSTLSREQSEGKTHLECPSVRPPGCTSSGAEGSASYARRSILRREQLADESFPTPRGGGDGFGKKNLLVREMGLPQQSRAVAAH